MSFSARYAPAVLITLLSLTVSLCAQSTTRQTNKTPRGTVSGRVTIKDKGAAGVAIGLRRSDGVTPFEAFLKATTDHDGFYRITNVAAGNYEIVPSAPAFVIADNNNSRVKTVVVGEDENVEGINFSLVRGGVVTGKVTDAEGRPVIQQQVYLYRADAFEQQRQQRPVFSSASAQTDDRGVYRMFGLSAGRYKVATGRGDDTSIGSYAVTRTTYKQVFHPDVAEQTKATIIEVSEGSETKDVDISVGRVLQTFSVSGRVVDGEKGLPMPNVRFGFQRGAAQRFEFVNSMAVSNAQGDFIVEGLIPGKYGISLLQNQNAEMRAEAMSFDVIDQDVTGVIVKLNKGASVTGVVVFDSEDKVAFQKLLRIQLRAFVMVGGAGGGLGNSAMSPISPDGSFRLAGLPAGAVSINLGSPMGPMDMKGFVITRIERDGIALPHGVQIKEGEQVTGLRVTVSYGNANLRGVVKLENGSMPPGGRIWVRLTRPGESFSGFHSPQVDSRGHFLMEGLPPGVYELHAQIAVGQMTHPARVKREVSVQEGVVTELMLTIDLTTPQKP